MADRLSSSRDSLSLLTPKVQGIQIGKVTLRQDMLLPFLQSHTNVSFLCDLSPEARSTATVFRAFHL